MNFSGTFGSASSIWYPASGYNVSGASLGSVGYYGYYWSASPNNFYAYYLYFHQYGFVYPSDDDDDNSRARGLSVRCLQESK